ncbi:MAG: Low-affinity inorganic phosphate transporter 1 [Candidatus Anoxychlamydiales bacterium]|nr:Low-affinity inorganic phosphate transporter 1 [Candidatus Anoxychlamydiales bacterium]NGX36183.1 Low-affinity inorganic phosphate transporter 1 [Candidatus Anoxychlamydiales bacterium]
MINLKFFEYFTLLIGLYMAWNIGANDVANAVSTSVGSKALTLKKAVIIAGIFEFCGAYFLGGNVSRTIQAGIINPEVFAKDINIFIFGMLSALLATSLWLNLATYFKLPVSTTHAIIGAVLGFGAIIGGMHSVHWLFVLLIASSWLITPLVSGFIAYFIFTLLQRKILFALSPVEATKRFIPVLVFFVFAIFTMILIFGKSALNLNLSFQLSLFIAICVGIIFAIVAYILLRNFKVTSCPVVYHHPKELFSLEKAKKHLLRTHLTSKGETKDKTKTLLEEVDVLIEKHREKTKYSEQTSEYFKVEKAFGFLQIISLCLVAFAHGTNDVANAVGPVAAVVQTIATQKVGFANVIPYWILLLGAFGIVIGLATWGWRVVETIGHKITTLTPTRGFSAEFGAAITILLASKFGLPISTTHALVGGILGVGLAKGISALNLRTLRDIVLSWAITIPSCAIISIIIFYILKLIFY